MDASKSNEEKNAYIAKELMKLFPFKMVASVWRTEISTTIITTFKLQSRCTQKEELTTAKNISCTYLIISVPEMHTAQVSYTV